MAGIAGIAGKGQSSLVERMLDKLAHRGPAGRAVMEAEGGALGAVWPRTQATTALIRHEQAVRDQTTAGHSAQARLDGGKIVLQRDPIGVAPLYYGHTEKKALCFASEIKALLALTEDIRILPPGHSYDGNVSRPHFSLPRACPLQEGHQEVAAELRRKLEKSVAECILHSDVGAWLSGGLDSSTIVALARPQLGKLHTFAAGFPGAPDLIFALDAANFLHTAHHEVNVGLDEMIRVLPDVIYHLESFDALLVRSSITHYLVAKAASDYVAEVFSGEGGDELFGGYEYLKALPPNSLADELIDITGRLHNTALQRVDRSAAAHGLVAHVPFLHPAVVEYALRIPVEFKIRDGVEKWILRQAMEGVLPPAILNRPKVKFWQGTGLGEQLAEYAEKRISDSDLNHERGLPNGWTINSKEELMYYRVFQEHFGRNLSLEWMGRTKNAPRSP